MTAKGLAVEGGVDFFVDGDIGKVVSGSPRTIKSLWIMPSSSLRVVGLMFSNDGERVGSGRWRRLLRRWRYR